MRRSRSDLVLSAMPRTRLICESAAGGSGGRQAEVMPGPTSPQPLERTPPHAPRPHLLGCQLRHARGRHAVERQAVANEVLRLGAQRVCTHKAPRVRRGVLRAEAHAHAWQPQRRRRRQRASAWAAARRLRQLRLHQELGPAPGLTAVEDGGRPPLHAAALLVGQRDPHGGRGEAWAAAAGVRWAGEERRHV
jgi:hypothetical protein